MKEIFEVIVVEGKSDVAFLQTFLKADFIITNGSANDGYDRKYLIEIANRRGIIILTDPDYPGNKIRQEIESFIPSCKHAFIRKEYSIKKRKVGVAESTKEEVLRALENVVTFNKNVKGTLTPTDLFLLGISGANSSENKKKIIDRFHIGNCNSKTMLKRLNMLNVSKEELEQVINDK